MRKPEGLVKNKKTNKHEQILILLGNFIIIKL